jgi:hypothetical protein
MTIISNPGERYYDYFTPNPHTNTKYNKSVMILFENEMQKQTERKHKLERKVRLFLLYL